MSQQFRRVLMTLCEIDARRSVYAAATYIYILPSLSEPVLGLSVYSKPMLFALDTGAFNNVLSVRAGRQVSEVGSEDRLRVRGLSGSVNKVYTSEKATLRFGHLQQANLDMITLDLSTLSRHTGTEASGFLGFGMLRLLDVKLDYRDGLVDFEYDPKREPMLMR